MCVSHACASILSALSIWHVMDYDCGRRSYLRAMMSVKPSTWSSKGPFSMPCMQTQCLYAYACNHQPCPCRQIQNPTCSSVPAEVVSLFNRAVKCNARSVKTALFQKYLECGKDWCRNLAFIIVNKHACPWHYACVCMRNIYPMHMYV